MFRLPLVNVVTPHYRFRLDVHPETLTNSRLLTFKVNCVIFSSLHFILCLRSSSINWSHSWHLLRHTEPSPSFPKPARELQTYLFIVFFPLQQGSTLLSLIKSTLLSKGTFTIAHPASVRCGVWVTPLEALARVTFQYLVRWGTKQAEVSR